MDSPSLPAGHTGYAPIIPCNRTILKIHYWIVGGDTAVLLWHLSQFLKVLSVFAVVWHLAVSQTRVQTLSGGTPRSGDEELAVQALCLRRECLVRHGSCAPTQKTNTHALDQRQRS